MATYLCGGINGLSDAACKDWRAIATELLGGRVLDPMRRDYRGIEDQTVTDIVSGDLDDIRACEFLLVNATKPSWGTAMEIVYARQFGKHVIAYVEGARISPWLRYHCAEIVETVEDACAMIRQREA